MENNEVLITENAHQNDPTTSSESFNTAKSDEITGVLDLGISEEDGHEYLPDYSTMARWRVYLELKDFVTTDERPRVCYVAQGQREVDKEIIMWAAHIQPEKADEHDCFLHCCLRPQYIPTMW